MDPETARAAREFLLRAELKGAEVPVWVQCMRALEAMMQPAAMVPPPSEMEVPNGE